MTKQLKKEKNIRQNSTIWNLIFGPINKSAYFIIHHLPIISWYTGQIVICFSILFGPLVLNIWSYGFYLFGPLVLVWCTCLEKRPQLFRLSSGYPGGESIVNYGVYPGKKNWVLYVCLEDIKKKTKRVSEQFLTCQKSGFKHGINGICTIVLGLIYLETFLGSRQVPLHLFFFDKLKKCSNI